MRRGGLLRRLRWVLLTLPALFLFSCPMFFYVPLRITAYSPSRPVYASGEQPEVWVEFSAEVDRGRAEQAMSVSRAGEALAGRYSWNGNRVTFTPYEELKTGCEHVLRVDDSVEDVYGNSLEHEFIFRFRIGADAIRPTIVDLRPETPAVDCDPFDHETLGAEAADLYHPVRIAFSEPVDRASFFAAFSLSPAVSGYFEWSDDATVMFVPAEPYDWQTEYNITIGTELADREGNTLAQAYSSRFFVGTDRLAPTVVSVSSLIPSPSRNGTVPEAPLALTPDRMTNGWEADWDILVVFSEPVTEESVESAFSFSPAIDFRVVFDHRSPDRAVLKRNDDAVRFRFGESYVLRIKAGISDRQGNKTAADSYYHFTVNGAYTKPPAVVRVYHLPDAAQDLEPGFGGTWDWRLLRPLDVLEVQNAGGPPYKTSILDFYFSCAERVTLGAASFAEHFRMSYENGCIDIPVFSSIRIITPPEAAAAYPPPAEGPDLPPERIIVRVFVRLVDTDNNGSITLALGRDFCDQSLDNSSLHNPLEADWRLRLRDPD